MEVFLPAAHAWLPDDDSVQAPACTDWLTNELLVSGPPEVMERFQAAAAGPGIIPWNYDFDAIMDGFLDPMLANPDSRRAISVPGARILARRLRDGYAQLHQEQMAGLATNRRCPFDLHRLVPVPPGILHLGPHDPRSRAWLWSHWSTTRALRHVRQLPVKVDRRRALPAMLRVGFDSADWSPWQAIRRLARAWPQLRFQLRPVYPEVPAPPPVAGAR